MDDGCVGTERVNRTNYIIVNFDREELMNR
jgi:hypothetical protein